MRKLHFGSTLLACVLLAASKCQASFSITVDTSPLIGNPAGPFYLDFQLTDGMGTGDGNSTIQISNFDFHGGGWIGPDPGTITLNDTSFFSEYFQGFTPGNTLGAATSMTFKVDSGPTPDQFSFAILDSSLWEIPTLGPADALMVVDLNSANPLIKTFRSDLSRTSIDIAEPTIVAVPEPSTYFVGIGCLLMLGCGVWRK